MRHASRVPRRRPESPGLIAAAVGRIGDILALPLGRHNSIKLHGSTNVYSRTGTGYYLVGVAWQYRWGGGF